MGTREAIEARQLALLGELLARVPKESFYGRKFSGTGTPRSLQEFSTAFPFTTKQELAEDQKANPPFGTTLTEPLERYTRFHQTSGTTAAPVRWLDTPDAWSNIVECWMRVFTEAGVTPADRVFFAFSFGPFLGFWMAFDAAQRLGCLCIPAGGQSSAARLRMLLDTQATILCCTPTYAARLAEAAREENIDLRASKVRRIMVAGEAGGSIPSVRARLESLWPGATVFDHHGMTEVGPVTYECPANPCRLHVMEHAFIAEILSPQTLQAVPRGEPGELVLTTLVRHSSPLFRYRTGDLVRALAGPCPCGRAELALDGGILGRADDMAVVRGVNVYPSAVEEILGGFSEVAEYRITLKAPAPLTELEVQVEARADATADLTRRIQHALHTSLNLRIPVHQVTAGSLPRSEMKAKRWVRLD